MFEAAAPEAFRTPPLESVHRSSRPSYYLLIFEGSYYFLPTRFIGRKVVRGGRHVVRIFLEEQLVKTHPRAVRPGSWRTDLSDYPPEKLA